MKQRLKKFLFSFFKDQLLEYESPYKDIPVYCNEKYDIEEVVTQVYFDNETLKEAYKSYHESYDAAIETAKRQMFEEVMKHVKVDIEVLQSFYSNKVGTITLKLFIGKLKNTNLKLSKRR